MRRFNAGAAFASYALLTALLGRALLRRFGSSLPSDPGDPVLNTWILWWNAVTLPFTDAWWNAPAFYPLGNVIAFSEHLVGLSVIATPVIWLTGNPVVAYNTVFLLTFPLSGLAGYWLGHELTGRRDAAWIAGLAFAFAPYRIDQVAHVQVLAAYWMPVGLAALHRFYRDPRTRWLVLFAAAVLMQGLSNLYFLLFYPVLVILWILWFTPNEGWWRKNLAVGAAGLAGVLPQIPLLLRYRRVHETLGFDRLEPEITDFAADVSGLLSASPFLSVWGELDRFRWPEGQLFPGLTLAVLLTLALWQVNWRPTGPEPRGLRVVRLVVGAVGLVFAVLVATRLAFGPWEIHPFGWKIAVNRPQNVLSQGLLFWVFMAILSPVGAWAYRRHSPFAFYLLAACLLGVLALGPSPTFFGTYFMAYSPYQGLTFLPGFESLRVPARFWMLATLCLSTLAGLAFARLVPRGHRWQPVLVGLASVGILADGWGSFPIVPAPTTSAVLHAATGPVIELPVGWRDDDLRAMLRSAAHGQPVVNGYSGYYPPHYEPLQFGLNRHDPDVLTTVGALGVTTIRVDLDDDFGPEAARYVDAHPMATRLRTVGHEVLYSFSVEPAVTTTVGATLPIAKATTTVNQRLLPFALDGDLETRWDSNLQAPWHEVTIDLGVDTRVGAVVTRLAAWPLDFPRDLLIEVSSDGATWREAWRGGAGGLAVVGTLVDPDTIPLVFPVSGRMRYIRLRQLATDAGHFWSIAELSVHAEESGD